MSLRKLNHRIDNDVRGLNYYLMHKVINYCKGHIFEAYKLWMVIIMLKYVNLSLVCTIYVA